MVSQHVLTLANSIVGVSVLAMPFCFKQCGVILATVILILGAIMTRMVCHFLLKGSIMTRRRTYELLAFHTFGQGGKFLVEITIIGYLVGTLIAFLVVMGDLGPQILVEIFAIENNSSLRTIVMTALALFVAIPLGLLRNMDSLGGVSTVSALFYLFLVVKLFSEGIAPLWSGSYINKINYWRPAGVLQCIPIFSMALSCQTQVLGIYDILPEPSMQKMNEVVKKAVYICTTFYVCVGLLGYIAFCTQYFGGNVLLNFGPTWSTQLIKMCFVLSIAFSFPLVILPCRASLHSLIFKGSQLHHNVHDITTNYIPESRIRFLTVAIVGFTLVIGLLIPNIELVLGLVGSTCGSIICLICPTVIFMRVTSKNTTERLLAQTVFFIGVCIMVLTTYVTLYAVEQAQNEPLQVPHENYVTEILKVIQHGENRIDDSNLPSGYNGIPKVLPGGVDEPPRIPLDTVELSKKYIERLENDVQRVDDRFVPVVKLSSSVPKVNNVNQKIKAEFERKIDPVMNLNPQKNEELVAERYRAPDKSPKTVPESVGETKVNIPKNVTDTKSNIENKRSQPAGKPEISPVPPEKTFSLINNNIKSVTKAVASHLLNPESPAKESSNIILPGVDVKPEAAEQVKKEFVPEEFLKKLEEQNVEQKKLIEQQKEILAKLEQHHAEDLKREKVDPIRKESDLEILDNIAKADINLDAMQKIQKEVKLEVNNTQFDLKTLNMASISNVGKKVDDTKIKEEDKPSLNMEIKTKPERPQPILIENKFPEVEIPPSPVVIVLKKDNIPHSVVGDEKTVELENKKIEKPEIKSAEQKQKLDAKSQNANVPQVIPHVQDKENLAEAVVKKDNVNKADREM